MPARAVAVLGVVLAVLVSAAPGSAAGTSLPGRLAQALHAPYVDFSASGAVVLDLGTGRVVYAHNANLPLRPASNEKLAVT
ncbi:MAG TPA: D-alanyl-D-alanine carboxypeptidase, partial [Casimicrobiaceae bacterium]|nr:D-alanyl-D-alanine carboxypeptidase [Casimicrobiaceae bacterium]